MQVTDIVADMLTRIRNASSAKHENVLVPASKMKTSIAKILLDEGYIEKYEVLEDSKQGVIKLYLKYISSKKNPVIRFLKRVSKPGLRQYYGYRDMPKVMNGLGIAIVSTSKGLMTDKMARQKKVGGEVLAFVW